MSLLLAVLVLSLSSGRAEETAKRACCGACCANEKTAAGAASATPAEPLSARSVYQLEETWTDDAGKQVSLTALRGRPVVLAMFFASCEYACPILVSDMQRARQMLPADVRARAKFVLVSFDSVRDTPAALNAYRDRVGLDDGWMLLHGDPGSVQELAMVLGVNYKQDARGQFSHSNVITVLDDRGEIISQRAGLGGDVSELAKAVAAR